MKDSANRWLTSFAAVAVDLPHSHKLRGFSAASASEHHPCDVTDVLLNISTGYSDSSFYFCGSLGQNNESKRCSLMSEVTEAKTSMDNY